MAIMLRPRIIIVVVDVWIDLDDVTDWDVDATLQSGSTASDRIEPAYTPGYHH
jgi:hypothetical protein